MKKIFFIAFMALGMSAMAQHVTPLSIELAEVKIDSLRTLYVTEPTMYRASLEVVAQSLAKNAEDIKAAKSELKVEQAHAKEMGNSLKEATKMAASLKKLYAKEEGELKSTARHLRYGDDPAEWSDPPAVLHPGDPAESRRTGSVGGRAQGPYRYAESRTEIR